MKYFMSQLTYFFDEPEVRQNLGALAKYAVFLIGVIIVYTVIFHVLMVHVEGQDHSWLTGFYWTLTVMSTLGFGDITFHTDIGRLFSIVVLLSGIVLLLIMLPFTFIRYFYAPWLEAQLRLHAPRSVPANTRDHVIICRYESICRGLIRRLDYNKIPYFVVEPDPVVANRLMAEHVSVVTGAIDGRETYENMLVSKARLVFANAEDTTNTNIAFTIRETAPNVPIMALAEDKASIDVLELSGATRVLPLKQRLGEQLATWVKAGRKSVQIVGRFKDLRIGEFLAHDTMIVGKTLKETHLRKKTGVNVVGVRERGRLTPVTGETRFLGNTLPVVIGSETQLEKLNQILGTKTKHDRPVLVIGGGKVGVAATNALKQRGVQVIVVEKGTAASREARKAGHEVIIGDAADHNVLVEARLEEAAAVVLTTNDDAMNIYLAVYCRRLKPDLNIISRITRERNIDAIYRAGADSVLSYATLGREHIFAALHGRDPVLVGEGSDFFLVPVSESLYGMDLGASQIGKKTGLVVIAVERDEETLTNPPPTLVLESSDQLVMLGTPEQRAAFAEEFG